MADIIFWSAGIPDDFSFPMPTQIQLKQISPFQRPKPVGKRTQLHYTQAQDSKYPWEQPEKAVSSTKFPLKSVRRKNRGEKMGVQVPVLL